jgi:polyisoprenoid-binding protein YceI
MSTREWEGLTIPTPGSFSLDVAHTTIGFSVKHMMISKVRGRFEEFTGTINIAENPLESTAEATIKTASINTNQADRDNHLRSDDFFSAEKYENITFRTTRIAGHSGDEFKVVGELTIRDVTKEIELTLEFGGVGTSPWGAEVFGFSLTGEIDREEFGLTWNQALETGGVVVGKKVKLEIEGEAVRQS